MVFLRFGARPSDEKDIKDAIIKAQAHVDALPKGEGTRC
jgi:hypothetical protein